MTKTTEKLVLLFNPESQCYRPGGHNFSPEQAVEETQRLQGEGVTALIVDQERHHRALSFHQCKPCRTAADTATTKRNQAPTQEQPEQPESEAESSGKQ